MSKLVTRKQWGARDPRHVTKLPRNPKGFGVHYNGPALGLSDCNDGVDCAEAVRGTQNYHMDQKGWSDIAYSFLVCPSCGRVYQGRSWDVRTAANGTNRGNDNWHAVMVLIGDDEPITDAAKYGVLWLQRKHAQRYNTDRLKPHRRFKSTACPGKPTTDWLKEGAPRPDEEEEHMPSKEEIADETIKRLLRSEVHGKPFSNRLHDADVASRQAIRELRKRDYERDVTLLRRFGRAAAAKLGIKTKHEPPEEVEV